MFYLQLILNQASFALRASDGAVKDPQRQRKQHRQKKQQNEKRLTYFRKALTRNQYSPNAIESIGRWEQTRNVCHAGARVLIDQLSRKKDPRKKRRPRPQKHAKRITAFENHGKARRENS